MSNDAAAFALATDRMIASPEGLSTLGSDPASYPTEPPACYRASWQLPGPDSHRQATTSFSSDQNTILDDHLLITGRTSCRTRDLGYARVSSSTGMVRIPAVWRA
jgi:hypothetical protein